MILLQTLEAIVQQNGAPTLPYSDAIGTEPPTTEKSRKRKRDEQTQQASKKSTDPVLSVLNRQESLKGWYISVFRVVEWLIEASKNGPEEDGVAREHLKSLLRTDAVIAAKLFGLHIESMLLLLDADISFLDSASNWVKPYAEIWGYRERVIEDGTKAVSAVSLL